MEKDRLIQELEEEKAQCLARINRIDASIESIKNIDKIEVEVILTKRKKKLGTKKKEKKVGTKRRSRLTGEALEAKKRECAQLLKEGKLSKGEIAEKLGMHPSVIYYWAGYRKPGQDKKKLTSKPVKSHKKQCENCHNANATCFYESQNVCQKCFNFFKKGKVTDERDPEVYDPSDLDIDDDVLED